ncbi:unnamed protein product [Lactuca saligna]|uniref:Transmembrane protein n=1 Tax=Lactuca saligna TaxID=75948 RepID=A0AA36ELG4_LACSI|nr:unnamed protein product [Lactuca saligna]
MVWRWVDLAIEVLLKWNAKNIASSRIEHEIKTENPCCGGGLICFCGFMICFSIIIFIIDSMNIVVDQMKFHNRKTIIESLKSVWLRLEFIDFQTFPPGLDLKSQKVPKKQIDDGFGGSWNGECG